MHSRIDDTTIDDIIESVSNPQFDISIEVRKRDSNRMRNRDRWRDYWSNTKIYVFPKGEYFLNQLMNRKSRPYKMYRKEIIPTVLESLNWEPDTKIRWSQYAGCSCPCSPGFRVNSYIQNHPLNSWYDIFVTAEIEGTGKVELYKTKR